MLRRKTPFVLVLGALANPASATLLIYEPFDYSAIGAELSDADGAGGWLKVPATTGIEPIIGSGTIPHPDLPFASSGNKIVGDSSGGGVMPSTTRHLPGQPFLSSDEPTLYYSLLLDVTNVTGLASGGGSFIAGFRSNTGTGGLASAEAGAPLLLRQTGTGSGIFNLGTGLTQNNTDRVWGTNAYDATTGPLLLVFSYEFIAGADDFARLYVNPDPTLDEASNVSALEVTATATDGHGISQGQITSFFFRNNGVAPDGWEIDELRIADTWEDLWTTQVLGIWQGGAGNWSNSALWSGNVVPNVASLPVQIDAGNAAASVVTLDQDASVRSVVLDADDTLNIDSGRSLTLGAISTLSGVVNSSGNINAPEVTVIGATAALNWNDGQMSLGRLQLRNGAKMTMAPGQDKTLVVASNSTVDVADGSELDVGDNKVIVQGGDAGTWNGTNYTGITGLVQAGRGDGTWNGPGIVTSMTDATTGVLTSLAVATADEVGKVGSTFGGVTVNSGDVLVMYTWGGDAQMDGDLDGDDYFQIDSNVAQSGSVFGYSKGDFNYDGLINGDDYFIIDSNIAFAQSQPPFPTGAGGSLSAVPEPAALGLLAMGAMTLRRRRRA